MAADRWPRCTEKEDGDDQISTTLECDDAGELRSAILDISTGDQGAPSWGPETAVLFAYDYSEDNEPHTATRQTVSLRRADDETLLVMATWYRMLVRRVVPSQ